MGTEPNPPKSPTLSAVAGRRELGVTPKGDTPLSCFKIGRAITPRIPQGYSKDLTDLSPTTRASKSDIAVVFVLKSRTIKKELPSYAHGNP